MVKRLSQILSKNLGSKFGKKFLDTKASVLKTTLKSTIQKTAETLSDLVENKIADKITRAATKSTHEDPKKLTTQIPQPASTSMEIYIPPEKQQQVIDLIINIFYYNRFNYNYKYIKRMEYQKIINSLNNANNKSTKFRTKMD